MQKINLSYCSILSLSIKISKYEIDLMPALFLSSHFTPVAQNPPKHPKTTPFNPYSIPTTIKSEKKKIKFSRMKGTCSTKTFNFKYQWDEVIWL